jgi:hypothetical protein
MFAIIIRPAVKTTGLGILRVYAPENILKAFQASVNTSKKKDANMRSTSNQIKTPPLEEGFFGALRAGAGSKRVKSGSLRAGFDSLRIGFESKRVEFGSLSVEFGGM